MSRSLEIVELGLPLNVEAEFEAQKGESYAEIVERHAFETAVVQLVLESELEYAA